MLLHLFWHSILRNLQSFRFAASFLVLFALCLIATMVNAERYTLQKEAYDSLVYQARQESDERYVASQLSPKLYWPPARLSIFAPGETGRLGNSLTIDRWSVPIEADEGLIDSQLSSGLPQLDFVSILGQALMLLSILMGYDAISGDRESGRLRQILSNSISRASIYISNYLASVTLLALAAALSLMASLIVLTFGFSISFSATELLAIGTIYLTSLATIGIGVGIGMLMSTLFARSSQSLLAAMVAWMVLAMIIPTMAIELARWITTTKNPNEITLYLQESEKQIERDRYKFRTENTPNALNFMGDGYQGQKIYVFDAPENVWADARDYFLYYEGLYRQRADDLYALQQQHLAAERNQAEVASLLSLFSPLHHLRSGLTGLASSGYQAHADQLEYARIYRREMLNSFASRGFFSDNAISFFSRRSPEERTQQGYEARLGGFLSKTRQGESVPALLNPAQFGPLPDDILPAVNPPAVEANLIKGITSFSLLLSMSLVLMLAGVIVFNRYDVR